MKYLLVISALLAAGLLMLVACQGTPTERTPIDFNPDMDDQPKYLPQAKSEFFADSATMRVPVAGTVARGELRADDAYYRGMDADGNPVKKSPVPVTLKELQRGEERFNIYCSPCHSRVGDGKGIMVQHGYVPPPSFHQDRIREFPDGHIFDVITHGIRNMPSYGHQIPVADRWAIIAYVRALQRSQNASINDVPVELREKVQKGSSD